MILIQVYFAHVNEGNLKLLKKSHQKPRSSFVHSDTRFLSSCESLRCNYECFNFKLFHTRTNLTYIY